jgi:hypothetical protein
MNRDKLNLFILSLPQQKKQNPKNINIDFFAPELSRIFFSCCAKTKEKAAFSHSNAVSVSCKNGRELRRAGELSFASTLNCAQKVVFRR